MELWKVIDDSHDSEPYEISSMGRLRRNGRILKPRKHPKIGYVQAVFCSGGKKTYPLVHRLVAEAFIGEIPEDYQVNHKNGIRYDNRVENLEIVTCSENNLHAFRVLGRQTPKGEQHPSQKYSEETIHEIRWLFAMGARQFMLAKEYGVDPTVIRDIVHRRTWKHV
jgi:HNH endonuclease/NUMOD4 motif-containing protein